MAESRLEGHHGSAVPQMATWRLNKFDKQLAALQKEYDMLQMPSNSGSGKGGKGGSKGLWVCHQCDHTNLPQHNLCNKCSTLRAGLPSPAAPAKGASKGLEQQVQTLNMFMMKQLQATNAQAKQSGLQESVAWT